MLRQGHSHPYFYIVPHPERLLRAAQTMRVGDRIDIPSRNKWDCGVIKCVGTAVFVPCMWVAVPGLQVGWAGGGARIGTRPLAVMVWCGRQAGVRVPAFCQRLRFGPSLFSSTVCLQVRCVLLAKTFVQ